MDKKITVIQGHPDAQACHFCHVLADPHIEDSQRTGQEIYPIQIAEMGLNMLPQRRYLNKVLSTEAIKQAQDSIGWADHLVIIYPLWLGTIPAPQSIFLNST